MNNYSIVFFNMIKDFLETFLSKQKGASSHTIKSYKSTLNQFIDYTSEYEKTAVSKLSFNNISIKLIESFLNDGETKLKWSISTRNQKLAALKSFFKFASTHDSSLMIHYLNAKNVPVKSKPINEQIDFFSEDELRILLNQPDVSKSKEMRNLVMMIVMYDTGCRIQELLDLKIADIHLDDETPYISVTGKGKKTRLVPIMEKTVDHLKKYLKKFHSYTKTNDEFLFYTKHNGLITQMSQDNVQKFIDKYCSMAISNGLKIKNHIYCHMFRHSRAMHLYRNGMELSYVSEWLGHAQINTTRSFYANANLEMKSKAIKAATVNFKPTILDDYKFDYDNDDLLIKRLYGLI